MQLLSRTKQIISKKMLCSTISVYASAAAVVYRAPFTWKQNKLTWKLVHGGLMFLALLLSIVGLCAVFDSHKGLNLPNMYSLHSWVGICTVAMFALQVWMTNICPQIHFETFFSI